MNEHTVQLYSRELQIDRILSKSDGSELNVVHSRLASKLLHLNRQLVTIVVVDGRLERAFTCLRAVHLEGEQLVHLKLRAIQSSRLHLAHVEHRQRIRWWDGAVVVYYR